MNDDKTTEKPGSEVACFQLEKDALDIINMRYQTQYRSLIEIDLAEILNTPPKHI
ncbi:MAG: hypothetical protein JXB09_01935 [Deltaproteobacteria bacterium]|nr:hypothetical protein [Deltaproteobacteria bacterium]